MAPPFGNLSNQPLIVRGDRPAGTPSENHVVTVQGAAAGYPLAVTQSSAVWITEDAADGQIGTPFGDIVIGIGGKDTGSGDYTAATFTGGALNVNAFVSGLANNIAEWATTTLGVPVHWGSPNTGAIVIGTNAEMFAGNTPLSVTTSGSPAVSSLNVNVTNQTPSGPYASLPVVSFVAVVGLTSALVLAANTIRKGLTIQNVSLTGVISFAFSSPAVILGAQTLYPGGSFWMDSMDFSTSAIYAIADTVGSNLVIQEFD
jgi:hypothetical protein